MENKDTNNHGVKVKRGGRRPGSGRRTISPGIKSIPICMSLPEWMAKALGTGKHRNDLIRKAIEQTYNLKPE